MSSEAAVASDNLPAEGVQRVYGRQGRLCATCFLVGYRTVVGT